MADKTPFTIADAIIAALIVFSVLWGLFHVSGHVAFASSAATLIVVLLAERSHHLRHRL